MNWRGMGWWSAWTVLALYRALQVVLLVISGNPLGLLLVIPESLALGWGVANAFVAKSRDYRLVGLWVPTCYAVGIFVVSGGALYTSPVALAVFICAECLSVWALFCLRSRFSVAGAAWVSLCDVGPYRWVRHPQLLARVIFILACAIPAGDWIGLVAAVGMTISVVLVEEGHLLGQDEYRRYAERVRYRLVPGVF